VECPGGFVNRVGTIGCSAFGPSAVSSECRNDQVASMDVSVRAVLP
jgi:hypothetical protein